MPPVEFEEPQYGRPMAQGEKRLGIAQSMIKMGIARDEAGAEKVLVAVFIVAVLLTLVVVFFLLRTPPQAPVPL